MKDYIKTVTETYGIDKYEAAEEIICMSEVYDLTDGFDFDTYEVTADKAQMVTDHLKSLTESNATFIMGEVFATLDARQRQKERKGKNLHHEVWCREFDAGALLTGTV